MLIPEIREMQRVLETSKKDGHVKNGWVCLLSSRESGILTREHFFLLCAVANFLPTPNILKI